MAKHNVYSPSFRKKIVKESDKALREGFSLVDFARDKGLPVDTLRSWRHTCGGKRFRRNKKYANYSEKDRCEIVEQSYVLTLGGRKTVAAIAKKHKVAVSCLYAWRAKYGKKILKKLALTGKTAPSFRAIQKSSLKWPTFFQYIGVTAVLLVSVLLASVLFAGLL